MKKEFENVLFNMDNSFLTWESFDKACKTIILEHKEWVKTNIDKPFMKNDLYQFWLFLTDDKNIDRKVYNHKELTKLIEYIHNKQFFENVIKTNMCFYYETFYTYFKLQKITLRSLKVVDSIVIDPLNFVLLLTYYFELLKYKENFENNNNSIRTYRPSKEKVFAFDKSWENFVDEIKNIDINKKSFLTLDIKSFYKNIDRYKIEEFLETDLNLKKDSKEHKIFNNFLNILENFSDDGSIPFLECCPLLTFLMSELFLNTLLGKIKNHNWFKNKLDIFHYVDDIIIVYDKESIEKNDLFIVINNVLEKYKLTCNDSKTFFVENIKEFKKFKDGLPPRYSNSFYDAEDVTYSLYILNELFEEIESDYFKNIPTFINNDKEMKRQMYILKSISKMKLLDEDKFIKTIIDLNLISKSIPTLCKYPHIFINFINYSDYLLKTKNYDISFNKNIKANIFKFIENEKRISKLFLENIINFYCLNRKSTFNNEKDEKIFKYMNENMPYFSKLINTYKKEFNIKKLELLSKNKFILNKNLINKWFQINVFKNRYETTMNKNFVVISLVSYIDSLLENIYDDKGKYFNWNIKKENINFLENEVVNMFFHKKDNEWVRRRKYGMDIKNKAGLLYKLNDENNTNLDNFKKLFEDIFKFRNNSSTIHCRNDNHVMKIENDKINNLFEWTNGFIMNFLKK